MQTAKKQSLIQQILLYRRRVSQYEALSNQIKNVSQTIQNFSASRQKLYPATSKSLTKKKVSDNYHLLPKSGLQRQISSSKKIKIYELQKKFFRIGKEHNQKFACYMFDKRQLEVNMQTCKTLTCLIDKQEIRKKTLNKQIQEVAINSNQMGLKFEQTQVQLESIQRKKLMILRQKDQIIGKLDNLKAKLEDLKVQNFGLSRHLQQNQIKQAIEFQLKYGQKNDVQVNKVQIRDTMYDVIESKSSIFIANFNKQHQRKLQKSNFQTKEFQNGNVKSNLTKQGNFKKFDWITVGLDKLENIAVASTQLTDTYTQKNNFKHSIQNKQRKQICQLNNSNPNEFQIQYSFSQVLNAFQLLEDNNFITKNKINLLQQEITSIQTQIRHHSTNLNLLKTKINSYSLFIQRQYTKQLSNSSKIQQLLLSLSQKQGYRGQIRGRIGTKVQQQTLLKMLNLAIHQDLQILHQKIRPFIAYKNLIAQQIIKKTL